MAKKQVDTESIKSIKKSYEIFGKLMEKYEGNDLFDNLLDISLNIDAIFTLLERKNYIIISKKEYEELLKNRG